MPSGSQKKSTSASVRPKPTSGDERKAARPDDRAPDERGRGESLMERLRGPRSLGYFLIFLGVALIIQGFHALEHIVQTLQIFVFGVPRPQAGGLLGSAFDFPMVHFVYNFTYFLALAWATAWAFGLGGFRRFDRLGMWVLIIAAGIQTYHAAEHVIQISQEAAVGTARPPGFIGLFADNVIAHLTLNLVEWVLPFIAFWRFGGIAVMKEWLLRRRVTVPAATA